MAALVRWVQTSLVVLGTLALVLGATAVPGRANTPETSPPAATVEVDTQMFAPSRDSVLPPGIVWNQPLKPGVVPLNNGGLSPVGSLNAPRLTDDSSPDGARASSMHLLLLQGMRNALRSVGQSLPPVTTPPPPVQSTTAPLASSVSGSPPAAVSTSAAASTPQTPAPTPLVYEPGREPRYLAAPQVAPAASTSVPPAPEGKPAAESAPKPVNEGPSLDKKTAPLPTCGLVADQKAPESPPVDMLCASGIPSPVTGPSTGPWTWTCSATLDPLSPHVMCATKPVPGRQESTKDNTTPVAASPPSQTPNASADQVPDAWPQADLTASPPPMPNVEADLEPPPPLPAVEHESPDSPRTGAVLDKDTPTPPPATDAGEARERDPWSGDVSDSSSEKDSATPSFPHAFTLPFAPKEEALDRPEAVKALDALVQVLKTHESVHATLLAYAPADSTSADVLRAARRLSLARALTIRDALTKQGVAADRFSVRALGGEPSPGDGPADRVDVTIP